MNTYFARFAASFVLIVAVGIVSNAEARPFRGGIPWSILLCKFSDSPAPVNDPSHFQSMMIASGTHGLNDYISQISYGKADMSGSSVHGWYTEPHTTAYEQGLTNRYQRLQDCVDAAASSKTDPYTVPSGQRIYVITSPQVDLVGFEGSAALGGETVALPEIAHEFGHGVGLEHSWSNDTTWRDISWAGWGEYDNPWDLMSAANVYVDPTGDFGGGPPDLDAHHLDEMGWLGQSRVLTLGEDGILSRTITLAALTHGEASGYLMARIPFDASDRFHYYTVEYRVPDSWDSGIPASIVMINEIKKNPSYYQTTLIRQLGSYAGTGNGPPVQSLNQNGVNISVVSTSATQATIQISTQFALPCAQGYVWRSASSIDRVCVTPATRTQTAADNAAADSRHLPNSTTCKQGYVWRNAYPGDVACVTPDTRTQAANDDANAYNNVDQTKVSYGPNTCQNGYVWRAADDSDYVCVSYATEAQTQADDAAAGSHHVSGSDTCKQGYVWRSAWPDDHVCVTPATRTQAQSDNAAANGRLANQIAMLTRATGAKFARDGGFSLVDTAYAADAVAAPEADTPAPVTEAVLRVRLAKMGYSQIQKVEHNGDYWDATVVKNGVTHVIRFHAQYGDVPKEVKP